jgi:hypothetical protein
VTWTNIGEAMQAGLSGTDPFIYGSPENFLWDGTYLYCKCRMQDITAGSEPGFVRSADLTGANDPADNWGSEIISNTEFSNGNAGIGEGYIINFGSISSNARLEYMSLGGTSLTLAADTFPSNTRSYPTLVAFDGTDKWCAMNLLGQAWSCDTSGAGTVIDPSDWVASSGYLFGDGATGFVHALFYDKGSDGTNGAGFVAVVETGTGAATQTHVYTNPDGEHDNWTLQESFATESYHDVWASATGKHPLRDTDIA